MSLATLTPLAGDPDDSRDFDAWEAEVSPTYRPTRAAERREGKAEILRQRGIRRHRTTEREG